MNWGEIKQAVWHKLDAPDQAAMEEYMPGLVRAANEGAALLATAGKPIRRSVVAEADGCELELDTLAPDFYRLDGVRRIQGEQETPTRDYRLEGGLLRLPEPGWYRLLYSAYEESVTERTEDNHPMALDAEAAVLLPLYIASQLYKHDNAQLAVLWRNEFEVGRELLQMNGRQRAQGPGTAEFVAERWF